MQFGRNIVVIFQKQEYGQMSRGKLTEMAFYQHRQSGCWKTIAIECADAPHANSRMDSYCCLEVAQFKAQSRVGVALCSI